MTDLARRYGKQDSSLPRWFWPIFAVVGVSIGIAWAAWVAWSDVPVYQARTFGYVVVDDNTTTVTIEIFRDEPVALSCHVYAQAEDKAYVGEDTIDVPASDEYRTLVTTELTTEREATTGALGACNEA